MNELKRKRIKLNVSTNIKYNQSAENFALELVKVVKDYKDQYVGLNPDVIVDANRSQTDTVTLYVHYDEDMFTYTRRIRKIMDGSFDMIKKCTETSIEVFGQRYDSNGNSINHHIAHLNERYGTLIDILLHGTKV